ncbi:unnamed protein product, partial [Meganyctiphanes norvegica]
MKMNSSPKNQFVGLFEFLRQFHMKNISLKLQKLLVEELSYRNTNLEDVVVPGDSVNSHSYYTTVMTQIPGQAEEYQKLLTQVKVLCWVMTNPTNHDKKAKHVKATWAQRCNKTIFFSSGKDEKLGTIVLDVGEGRNYLWEKTKKAFMYIFNNHYNDSHWFFKADDDTYV